MPSPVSTLSARSQLKAVWMSVTSSSGMIRLRKVSSTMRKITPTVTQLMKLNSPLKLAAISWTMGPLPTSQYSPLNCSSSCSRNCVHRASDSAESDAYATEHTMRP